MKWEKEHETKISQGQANICKESDYVYTIYTKYGIVTAMIYKFPNEDTTKIRFDAIYKKHRFISYFSVKDQTKLTEHSLMCKAIKWIQKLK